MKLHLDDRYYTVQEMTDIVRDALERFGSWHRRESVMGTVSFAYMPLRLFLNSGWSGGSASFNPARPNKWRIAMWFPPDSGDRPIAGAKSFHMGNAFPKRLMDYLNDNSKDWFEERRRFHKVETLLQEYGIEYTKEAQTNRSLWVGDGYQVKPDGTPQLRPEALINRCKYYHNRSFTWSNHTGLTGCQMMALVDHPFTITTTGLRGGPWERVPKVVEENPKPEDVASFVNIIHGDLSCGLCQEDMSTCSEEEGMRLLGLSRSLAKFGSSTPRN